MPASARAPTSPIADRAARRRRDLLSRHLPRPARRSRAPRSDAALLAARLGQSAGDGRSAVVAGGGRTRVHRARAGHRRRHPRAEGCAGLLPSRLRRRRCRERRHPGRPRRRPAALDPGAAAAPGTARAPGPTYLHHPLVAHADGRRLAKRDFAPTLAAMRDSGCDWPRPRRAICAPAICRLDFASQDA